MPAAPKHRDAIIRAAATLFRRNGYSATSTNDIVALSGAPKGSLYHYFPEGKAQIGEQAVRHAGEHAATTLRKISADQPTAELFLKAYGRQVADWMAASDFQEGCPITTVLLETSSHSPTLAAAGLEAFRSWREVIAESLLRDGFSEPRAARLAALAVSAIEGAMVQARVERSTDVIVDAADDLATLFRNPPR